MARRAHCECLVGEGAVGLETASNRRPNPWPRRVFGWPRWFAALFALLFETGAVCAAPREAKAPSPNAGADEADSSSRFELVLRVDGALGTDNERVLEGLIASQRQSTGLVLSFQHSPLPVASWLREVLDQKRALLIAILDVSAADDWRLTVVDAMRGRALVRSLPGGLATNAASLEAVASILNSAATALRDGLEVASQPLEQVVEGTSAPKAPAPPSKPVSRPVPSRPPSPRPPRASVHVRGSVAAALVSVADSVSTTPGVSAFLGVQRSSGLGIGLTAARYFPASFHTALGDLELVRTSFALGIGWSFELSGFRVEPELGLASELLQRSGADPVPGVLESAENSYWRAGPFAALRVRYPLFASVSLELAGSTAYMPRRVRFVAHSSETTQLAEVSRLLLGARLGLEIMFPWK